MKTHILTSLAISFLLTACGGGGGGSATTNTPVVSQPVIAATLYDTSYKNFKSFPVDTLTYPTSNYGLSGWEPLTYGYGEFNKQGELGVFIANQNYTPQNDSLATVTSDPRYLSDFTFWTVNSDKTLTRVSSVKGCLHPRKAVVADFNRDGLPDVYVACTGYDSAPFPGEKSKLLMSVSRGVYNMTDVGDVAFNHGASAADVNNDGYPDIAVVAGQGVFFYINQRNGTFVKDETRVSNVTPTGYYSIELIDANNDNIVDIVAGGAELTGPAVTKIFYGDNTGNFGATTTVIPSIQGLTNILDFTLIGTKLYVGRAYDNTKAQGFYGGWGIQVVDLGTGVSTVLADVPGRMPVWFVPKTVNGQTGIVPLTVSTTFYH
jgi:hypothetical protein